MDRATICRECGGAYTARRATGMFCSSPCKLSFNNRRMQRGAVLYDLFMQVRHRRSSARKLGLWTLACRLATIWKEEDDTQRSGRQSWGNVRDVLERNPWLRAIRVGVDQTGTGSRQ